MTYGTGGAVGPDRWVVGLGRRTGARITLVAFADPPLLARSGGPAAQFGRPARRSGGPARGRAAPAGTGGRRRDPGNSIVVTLVLL